MDSFKRLFDDDEPIPENVLRNVEQKMNSSTERIRFVGNTSDLYLDKVGKTLAAFFGGGNAPKRKSSSNPLSQQPPSGRN